MPLTQLDPVAALVVIDLQQGVVGRSAAHPVGEIVGRAARLARAFRARGLPVVLVNVAGRAPGRTDAGPVAFAPPPNWTQIVPELGPESGDLLVTKHRWGAFLGTALDDTLRSRGATQIVLAGISTSVGVESTARCAYDLGYHVVLAADAMTDMSAEAHRHSVEAIFPRLGQVETTEGLLERLSGDFTGRAPDRGRPQP
jgi:nicotinamidase-related amidase